MKKMTQGATRLLVLALGLGLVSTAWAALTATEVWEADQIKNNYNSSTGLITGYNDSVYKLNVGSGLVVDDTTGAFTLGSDGAITVNSTATHGATIDLTAAGLSPNQISILVKYRSLSACNSASLVSAFMTRASGGKPECGLVQTANNQLTLKPYWCTDNGSGYNFDISTPSVSTSGGYLLFSYERSNIKGYTGSALNSMSGGSAAMAWTALTFKTAAIGGSSGEVSGFNNKWPNMVIEKIALFVGNAYSDTDIATYVFPSEDPKSSYDYVKTISSNTALSGISSWDKGTGTPGADSKVYIVCENNAVFTVDNDLEVNSLWVDGGSITLADGVSVSSTQIMGADINIAASTTVSISDSDILSKVSCSGVLNTSGTTLLRGANTFAAASILNVGGTKTTLNAGGTSLSGTINILADAELENALSSDALNYTGSPTVNVYGTLNMGSTRWTLRTANTVNLHAGGTITGTGDGNGALDADTASTINIKGTSTISAKLKARGALTLNVESGTLTYSGGSVGGGASIIKAGAGTIESSSATANTWTVSEGRVIQSVFPENDITIASGATYTLKNLAWTKEPSRFSGSGTLELFNDRAFNGSSPQHCTHTVTGVTFPGTLKFTATNPGTYGCGHVINNVGFLSNEVRPQLELDTLTGTYSKLFFNTTFDGQTLAVRDLKGTGHLSAKASTGTPQNQTLENMQTKDTEFSGNLLSDNASDSHKTNLKVIGDGTGVAKTLTLSGANTSNGELSIADSKVVFTSTGKWSVGTVTVKNGGVLESQNSGVIAATLAVKKGAALKFATGDQSIQATDYDWSDVDDDLEDDERIKVDISEATPSNTPISIIPSGVTVDVSKFVISPALNPYTTPYSAALSVDNGALKVTYSGNFCQDGSWLVGPTANGDAKVWLTQNSTLTTTTDLSLGSVAFSNRAGADVTLTVDGTGELKFGGLNLPSKITIDVAGKLTITGTVSGAGTINVLDGGELTMDDATCSTKITVQEGGKLYTKGTTDLSNTNNSILDGGLLEVVAGSTTFATFEAGIIGDLTVAYGAEFTIGGAWSYNHVKHGGTSTLDIAGTVNMGNKQWQFGPDITINLRSGATINGNNAEPTWGDWGFINNANTVHVFGDATIAASVYPYNTTFDVAQNATLTITGTILGSSASLLKSGLGDLDITGDTLAKPLTINGGKVVAAAVPTANVTINENGTFTLKNASWTGDADKFSGMGTLELLADTNAFSQYAAASTFSGKLKVIGNSSKIPYFNGTAPQYTNKPEFELSGYMTLTHQFAGEDKKFTVRNLTGATGCRIDPYYDNTAKNPRYVSTLQTRDTEFAGTFISENNATDRKTALYVYGQNETVHSLTLSGINTSYGPLKVDTYGKVVFTSGGSWRNGEVTVGANGYLESTNATAITKLALADGANIVFPTSSSSFTGISSITFASGTVTISYPSGVTPTSGTKLINWSSAPAGSFVFDNDSDVKQFGESYYLLQKEADGLYVRKAIALTITPPSTYYYHPSVAAALLADNTAYLLDAPNEVVVLAVGKTINNAMGKDVSNLTVNPTTAEYAVQYVNGSYTVANTSTTYYWTGTTDSAWATLGNWKVGASDGPVATRAVGSSDSVVLNDGAIVTLDAGATVAGMAVNGAVSISGTQVELKTSGNVTGTGTLTLSDVCLSSVSAGITVAPNVHFTNDSELAGDNALTINGNVQISGAFLIWGANHIVNGTVQIDAGANFNRNSQCNQWLMINGAATVKGAFTAGASHLKFNNALTIEAGSVTAEGSNVNVDSTTVSIVLAGANATYTDSRETPIADNKVSTTVADSYVKKTGSTFAVAAKPVVTISVGANVSLTINGSAVADGDTFKFFPGDTFTYAATPAANYTANVAVAGGTDNDGTVTVGETAITVAATATCNGATVSNVAVSYGPDYTSATVTAIVSDSKLDYYISWGSGEPVKGSVSGSQVTFDVSGINHTTEYQSAGYTITAKDGETAVTTTGGEGTTVAADVVAAGWINERAASATGTSGSAEGAGGSWSNTVTYTDGTATITNNSFTATSMSTSSRVVMEFNVCFTATSDGDVSGEAQGALKLGEVNDEPTFMVLKPNGVWDAVSHEALTPDPTATNKVVMTFDYALNKYGVSIDGNVLTNSLGEAFFPLAKNNATGVQDIDFAGIGTLVSMKGDQLEGYMVKDNAGGWYATIQAAIDAYDSANGPYTVLHDGTAPSGWKIDGSTLMKVATGLFFMAY